MDIEKQSLPPDSSTNFWFYAIQFVMATFIYFVYRAVMKIGRETSTPNLYRLQMAQKPDCNCSSSPDANTLLGPNARPNRSI
ncbi:unnamed protein product [Calicophoron daubneyi]|uniref:ATP synthase F0 subunit 8 n=1 Tax=Calicophoron daubneyi TaxID=300641 RepID=A0AAV2TAM3_CALDB